MRRYAHGAGLPDALPAEGARRPRPAATAAAAPCAPAGCRTRGCSPADAAVEAARSFARGHDIVIEPRKLWPSGLGAKGTIKGRITGAKTAARWPSPTTRAGPNSCARCSPGPTEDGAAPRCWTAWWPCWRAGAAAGRRGRWRWCPCRRATMPRLVASVAAHVARVGRLPVLDVLSARRAAAGAGCRFRRARGGAAAEPAGAGGCGTAGRPAAAGGRTLPQRLDRHRGRRPAARRGCDGRAAAGAAAVALTRWRRGLRRRAARGATSPASAPPASSRSPRPVAGLNHQARRSPAAQAASPGRSGAAGNGARSRRRRARRRSCPGRRSRPPRCIEAKKFTS